MNTINNSLSFKKTFDYFNSIENLYGNVHQYPGNTRNTTFTRSLIPTTNDMAKLDATFFTTAAKHFLMFLLLITIASCADDGAPGPKGDKGDTGETGAKGDKGEEGPQGPEGTANVMYSDWMEFNWNMTNDRTFKQMAIQEAAITDDFLESGGILLVYLRASNPNGQIFVTSLPYFLGTTYLYAIASIIPDPDPNFPEDFISGILLNNVALDGSTTVTTFQDEPEGVDYEFRYILIPGGTPLPDTSNGRYKFKDVDYEELKLMFLIPD